VPILGKIEVFLKPNAKINFLHNLALFGDENANFSATIGQKLENCYLVK
jgi:hypothetical protein